MVLDSKIKKQISDFVYNKPRTIQEIAQLIGKNWRTAERYINKIMEEDSVLGTRTFREGTRGALKVVFWNNIEKIHSSEFQEHLFTRIIHGRKKEDFSPLDIYQYIEDNKKNAFIIKDKGDVNYNLIPLFEFAQKQILCFSGNLSWLNKIEDGRKVYDVIKELIKNNIPIKIICRIDIASIKNLDKISEINNSVGKSLIEVRHFEHPLRGFIIDDKLIRLKEEKDPRLYREGELDEKTIIIYDISNKEWIEWLQKVFWNLFRTAIPLERRISEIEKISISQKL